MYQRVIFLLCLCFLVGCAQIDNDRQAETVQPSETPTIIPTTTSTPTPTFTLTPSLTPTITPTPTEVPSPLPPGAAAVLKEGSLWVAYDAQNHEVAVWLPDPDTGEEDWRQRYVKNQEGDIFRWDVPGNEWDKVQEPRGAVDGWMDLDGKNPVWKIDISSLHEEDDPEKFVTIGEFNRKWEMVPFEVMLPDEIIKYITSDYPFYRGSGIESVRTGGTVYVSYYNTVLLGLKFDINKKLQALVGDPKGIAQTQVDLFNIIDGPPENDTYVFVPEITFGESTVLMKAFKSASETVAGGEGSHPDANFDVTIWSPVENTSLQEGCTMDSGYVHGFFDACTKLENESDVIRSSNQFDLAAKIKNVWAAQDRYPADVDWWAVAPEIPEGYIGWIGFVY